MRAVTASAPGKIILFGEHAVVYGRPAIAAPFAAVRATAIITTRADSESILIHALDLNRKFALNDAPGDEPLGAIVRATLEKLAWPRLPGIILSVTSTIPVAGGLGSSAAVSTAIVRALARFAGRDLPPQEISALVYETEKIHHGTPSGIDNTVIAHEQPVFFVRGRPIQTLGVGRPLTLIVGDTGVPVSTRLAVNGVRQRHEASPAAYERLFDEIAEIVIRARAALERGDVASLGLLMDENHALLRALGVSSPELDRLVSAARRAGALGAKMSGGGLGGNMISLAAQGAEERIKRALEEEGAKRVWETIVGDG